MKFFELRMRLMAPLVVLCGFVCFGSPAPVEAQSLCSTCPVGPTAAPGWTLLVHATGVSTTPRAGGEALAADLSTGNLFVKSHQDPSGSDLQFVQVAQNGTVTILGDVSTLTDSDGSGIAINPGVGGGLMVADEVGNRIASIGLTNPLTSGTLFSIPWKINPNGNGTGQQQYAPILTQTGTGPTHLLLYFWDSTTATLYSVETTAPTVFTTLKQLDTANTMNGTHLVTAGNHVVYDSNSKTLLLTDGSSNTVIEVNPANSPATTSTLFSNLPGTPTSIALKSKQVFLQIGNSIYVANRTGGPLSLVASGFSQLTGLVVGNASSSNGLSLFAVDKNANKVYEIPLGVVSEDPNFTPAVLASGLSGPANGVVFRPPTGDLVVSQFLANQVSLVNATSGAISAFANQTAPDEVAVRSSDGLVAVKTHPDGPIDFYNSGGGLQGSIPVGNPNACITGLAFDGSGNLFVAAGPGTTPAGGCQSTGWAIYEFPQMTGQPTPSTTASTVATGLNGLEGLVFNAAPLPSGSLYAISFTAGNVYHFLLGNTDPTIATVPPTTSPSGIAVDPLLGDIYISEFNGTDILRIRPGGGTPTTFATGFTNTLGLGFDTNGNLYVNEYNAGKIWKFSRASFATPTQPLASGKTNTLTFTNPNPAMSDQIQTVLIPASANLNRAASLQIIFVQVDPATLNARLAPGSSGDRTFFGGAPVAPGSTCFQVPSANNKCVVQIQKCYDANGNSFDICPVQEPSGSSDLIQLTFKYTGSLPLNSNPGFLIDYDTPPNNQTLTDITTGFSSDPTGSGGTKTLCSQTLTVNRATPTGPDFSLSSISPIALGLGGSGSATVTVNSISPFASQVALGVSDAPAGVSASLSPTSVTPLSGGSSSSTLNVSVGPSVTPSTFTLIVTGNAPPSSTVHLASASVTVSATTAGISNVIASLLANGCIDNSGIANALTSKLSAAQSAISGGQTQTAINILTAFKNQVQAQAGKHIATSCTIPTGGVTFNPVTVLLTDAQSLINSLRTSLTADPITGFVVNSSGMGVAGATVSLLSGSSTVATATTDITGFYYFATTSTLTVNSNYTVQVTVPMGFNSVTPSSQPFTWLGSGLAFNFTLN